MKNPTSKVAINNLRSGMWRILIRPLRVSIQTARVIDATLLFRIVVTDHESMHIIPAEIQIDHRSGGGF
jgi:hypothetical protein